MHARANTVTLGSVKKTHDLSFTIPSGHRSMCAGQHLCVLKGNVTERKLDWITEVRIVIPAFPGLLLDKSFSLISTQHSYFS